MTQEKRLILFLCGLVSIGFLAMVIYLPSLPAISQDLHASSADVELTLTLYMLTFALSQLIYGPLSDHFGRKPIILLGTGLYVIFTLISALAPSIKILLLARALEGIGAGGITALARAAINDSFTGKTLTVALSYTSIFSSLGVMLSPSIGSYLQVHFSWRANFYFLGAYSFVFWVITWVWFKETKEHLVQESKSIIKMTLKRYGTALRNNQYVLLMLSGSCCYAGSTVYYVASPFIYEHALAISPENYGHFFLLTSGCFIIGGFMNQWLHSYEKQRLLLGLGLMILASIILLSCGYSGYFNVLVILLPMALYLFAMGIFFPTVMLLAVRPLKAIAGTVAAVMGCCQVLAASLSTALMAHLPQNNQVPMASVLMIIVAATVILIGLVLRRF